MSGGRRIRISTGILAVLVSLSVASPVSAAFPGTNGKIYFQSCGEPCANFDIYAVNPDGSGLENVTDVVTDGAGPPESAFDPSVSADGKVLAFGVDTQATSEIWVMNTDGTGARQLTNDNLLDQEPTISPNGTRIAWNQWSPFPTYTDRDIWVMNSDRSGQQLLFNGFGEDYYPQFTPDGRRS
jgi:Tol biopolymer transport system component